MEGKKLLHSIRLQNILSYGSEGVTLELEPLNVLIGPNASGKSNLIEAISLLAAAPRNLTSPFRDSSVEDWLWKGSGEIPAAYISVVLEYPKNGGGNLPLHYSMLFTTADIRLRVVREGLISEGKTFLVRDAKQIKIPRSPEGLIAFMPSLEEPDIGWDKIDHQQSILSQVRDPINYPQLSYTGDQFGMIRFFRGWPFGRGHILRRPQEVSLPDDFLLEDGSNLGLILSDLQNRRTTKRLLLEQLQQLYENVEDVRTKVQGGTIQVFFHEAGLDRPIPATRLSDGTLHYLCLLTVLLHPDPPPLICIEEPELGLHPDVIPTIAELLIDASKRSQLIVTTHSEALVSALSQVPESVIVCERDDRGTRLQRLEPEKLKEWLERYRLGELWAMGEIGGNR
jgi:predicted ATPase